MVTQPNCLFGEASKSNVFLVFLLAGLFSCLEGSGLAPSVLKAIVQGRGVWGRVSSQPMVCSPFVPRASLVLRVLLPQQAPLSLQGRSLSWDRVGLRPALLLFRILPLLFFCLFLLLLKARVFKPIFCCFSGVLAEVRRRCLCAD